MNLEVQNIELLSLMNIMYVDTDVQENDEHIVILRKIFYSVDICTGAIEALSAYTTKLYDIVITNNELPMMNGFMLAAEMQQINPNQKIIMLFNKYNDDDIQSFLSANLETYIVKPVDIYKEINTFINIAKSIDDTKKLAECQNNNRSIDSTQYFNPLKELLKNSKRVNIVLLNVDSFKNINDSYGLEYGDMLLEYIHQKLEAFNTLDMDIFRLDSDEFALVDTREYTEDRYVELADLITSYFKQSPVEISEELEMNISISIGIAHGVGLGALNNARLAIRELREHTRGTYNIYHMDSNYIRNINDNIYWTNKIQTSVVNDNVIPFFQPIYNNKTKEIEKYECLARILDDGEYVSPYKFMDAAKNTRVIPQITKSMIKESCRTFRGTDYEFSINVTNDDFALNYLEEYLLRNANIYDIKPEKIVIELLEDIPSLDKVLIVKQLLSLKEKGFKVAIDDFGSYNSNFSRLLEFKPDYLKIDGTFVKNILIDTTSQLITEGIINIAHKLGIKVIAEYIHSQEVQDKIVELDVDYSQGYYHGEPKREI